MQSAQIRSEVEDKREEKLIGNQEKQERELPGVVTNNEGNGKADYGINNTEQEPEYNNTAEMFAEKLIVLGNIPVVVIGDSQVKQNIQEQTKAEEGKI